MSTGEVEIRDASDVVIADDGTVSGPSTARRVVTTTTLLLESKEREMASAFRIATSLSRTTMVREQYRQAENGEQAIYDLTAAILYGLRIGIDPEFAGQLIFSIHGMPAIESKTMVGLIRTWCDKRVAQGRTKTFAEGGDWIWPVEEDEAHSVWAARRDGNEVSAEWTMERANRAGYSARSRNKPNVPSMYETVPIEMLRAKAQGEVARILFSDVLRGMQFTVEELELIYGPEDAKPAKRKPGKGVEALRAHRASMAEGSDTPIAPAEVNGDESKPVPASDHPGRPDLASTEQLKQIRAAYKKRGLTGQAMLDDIASVLKIDLANVNDIRADQVEEILLLAGEPVEDPGDNPA